MDLYRELIKSYNENLKFRDYVEQDVNNDALFFDMNAFAELHDVDGHKIPGVFTSEEFSQGISNAGYSGESQTDGLRVSGGVFYCHVKYVSGVRPGQSVRLDGKLYQVRESRKIRGLVWRIALDVNEG